MHGAKRDVWNNIFSNLILTISDCCFVWEMELMKNSKSEFISRTFRYALRWEVDVLSIITVDTRTWIVGSLVTSGAAFGGLWIPVLTLKALGIIITEMQTYVLPVKQKELHVTSYTEHDTRYRYEIRYRLRIRINVCTQWRNLQLPTKYIEY